MIEEMRPKANAAVIIAVFLVGVLLGVGIGRFAPEELSSDRAESETTASITEKKLSYGEVVGEVTADYYIGLAKELAINSDSPWTAAAASFDSRKKGDKYVAYFGKDGDGVCFFVGSYEPDHPERPYCYIPVVLRDYGETAKCLEGRLYTESRADTAYIGKDFSVLTAGNKVYVFSDKKNSYLEYDIRDILPYKKMRTDALKTKDLYIIAGGQFAKSDQLHIYLKPRGADDSGIFFSGMFYAEEMKNCGVFYYSE